KLAKTDGEGTKINRKNERREGDPYPLPPPPSGKGTIKATLYGCWAGRVPANGERSVKQSLEDILGPDTVTAFDGVVKAKVAFEVIATNAASEKEAAKLQAAATEALEKAAEKGGFHGPAKVGDWLTATPFEDQYRNANAAIGEELKGKVIVKLDYAEPDPPMPVGSGSEAPIIVTGGGVRVTFG